MMMQKKIELKIFIPFESGHSELEIGIVNYLTHYYLVSVYKPKDIDRVGFDNTVIQKKLPFNCRSEFRFLRLMYSILNMFYIRFILERNQINLFLAYENFAFYVTNIFSKRIFCFEHNNIDELKNSRIKSILYKIGSRNTISIVFSKCIGDYVRFNFGRDYRYICHPIRSDVIDVNRSRNYESDGVVNIFAPSALISERIRDKILQDIHGRFDVFVYFKGTLQSGLNWFSQPFYYDYQDKMNWADCVLITGKYKRRISGVMIDALKYKRKVFLFEKSCVFDEYITNYPTMVFYYNSFDNFLCSVKISISDDDYENFIIRHSLLYDNGLALKGIFDGE